MRVLLQRYRRTIRRCFTCQQRCSPVDRHYKLQSASAVSSQRNLNRSWKLSLISYNPSPLCLCWFLRVCKIHTDVFLSVFSRSQPERQTLQLKTHLWYDAAETLLESMSKMPKAAVCDHRLKSHRCRVYDGIFEAHLQLESYWKCLTRPRASLRL